MTAQSDTARLDDVAPGDVISLTVPGADEPGEYKVVHKNDTEGTSGPTVIVTLEGDDGETCDVELPGDTVVERTLESKWESGQSPTPHNDLKR
ncbi:hypothetical protein FHR72_000661 [Mycolicibacterium iranicum]|uniref:Uncharacterized protein n=1 Tax=Mycolicibacterium iranicum TaxID=912594 RepID=A0A839Q2Q3_MYCIR|nr:hypothetical protein [Mycolicibacterium iranicum]MBB2989204.1 hypothetical protein [Mycolicibacterium iranicum]